MSRNAARQCWRPACDAIAPTWIASLAVAAVGVGVALAFARTLVWRVAGVVCAGVAAVTMLRLTGPVCTLGPFATLDPLVYRVWYRNVAEGLPAWAQDPATAFMIYALPLVGLTGTIAAWHAARGEARVRWTLLLGISAAAFAFSVLVARGAATANALAIPGAAWLLHGWLTRARAIRPLLPRIAATAGALVAAAPGLGAAALVGAEARAQKADASATAAVTGVRPCDKGHEIADLARLPAGLVYAPLDVSPSLLVRTQHRAIASGYHRNAPAIHAVLATFLGSPEKARAAVLAAKADYVAGCPGENETEIYKHLRAERLLGAARTRRAVRLAAPGADRRLAGARLARRARRAQPIAPDPNP